MKNRVAEVSVGPVRLPSKGRPVEMIDQWKRQGGTIKGLLQLALLELDGEAFERLLKKLD